MSNIVTKTFKKGPRNRFANNAKETNISFVLVSGKENTCLTFTQNK